MSFANSHGAILLAPRCAKWDNKNEPPVAYLAIRDQGLSTALNLRGSASRG